MWSIPATITVGIHIVFRKACYIGNKAHSNILSSQKGDHSCHHKVRITKVRFTRGLQLEYEQAGGIRCPRISSPYPITSHMHIHTYIHKNQHAHNNQTLRQTHTALAQSNNVSPPVRIGCVRSTKRRTSSSTVSGEVLTSECCKTKLNML